MFAKNDHLMQPRNSAAGENDLEALARDVETMLDRIAAIWRDTARTRASMGRIARVSTVALNPTDRRRRH